MSLGSHSCALTNEGTAYCWGANGTGQLGTKATSETCKDPSGEYPCSSAPLAVAPGLTFVMLSLGGWHTCGLGNNGGVSCWGNNALGQLGSDATGEPCPGGGDGPCSARPLRVEAALTFRSVTAGLYHTCALTSDSLAYCWGANNSGQLGTDAVADKCQIATDGGVDSVPCTTRPLPVAGARRFLEISAGGWHTCGITSDSIAQCWGDNRSGELGIAGVPNIRSPTPIADSIRFAHVSAGAAKTCGISIDGTAYCWGTFNVGAQFRAFVRHPEAVRDAQGLAAVTTGGEHACALGRNGRAYCWGDGREGQLGIGGGISIPGIGGTRREGSNEARPVKGELAFAAVSAGGRHTCGVTVQGTVLCWGWGPSGELGIGKPGRERAPKQVVPPRAEPRSPP